MFYKIVVLKDFEKLTGKHLYRSLCLRELLAKSSQLQHLNFGNFKERIWRTGFAYMKFTDLCYDISKQEAFTEIHSALTYVKLMYGS